ncbi:proteophosphoglycan ppg4 [Rhodotorula toruloides]|uniref:Proteophosphoglycan ppg4 n=1 Tax=Rhodotorula toruloides TaxID=5286 RepID=A0A511KE48_RHOTO|nr:proteophosphoglycan ppg4 [Rhodotorula toruloides]
MDAEASTSSATLQPSDADMTIDYDGGEQSMAAGAGDAEMGDEGTTVDEAEMRDDEAHGEADATFMTAYEDDTEVLADDDDETLPSSSAPLTSFTSISAHFEAFSAVPVFSAAPAVSSEPLTTRIELDNPSETLFQPPSTSLAPENSIPIPSEPAHTPAPLADAPGETDVALVETQAAVLAPTVGDGGSAARDLELIEAAGTSADVGAIEETSAGAQLDVVELSEPAHVVDHVPASFAEVDGTTSAEGDTVSEPRVNLAEVETGAFGADDGLAEKRCLRPLVDKDPLLSIDVPTFPSTSALRDVPIVYLTHDSTTWTLFHPSRDNGSTSEDTETEGGEENLPLLLGNATRHELYYKPLDTLLRVLREEIEELRDQADELVVDFDEIGISLSEDNIYSRQVTLFDFDRIHTGCQIPGRLHARIYSQPRFATGFNALAEHIARIASGASEEGEGEELEEGEESVTLVAEEGSEGEIREEGVEEEEGVADDHDGPDSELPQVQADEDDKTEEQEGEEGEGGDEEFDLDRALAQLDGDDVVVAVGGAQKDFLLEQRGQGGEAAEREEGEEQELTAEAGANEEKAEEHSVNVVEVDEVQEGEEARADEQEEEKTSEVKEMGGKEDEVAKSGESVRDEVSIDSTVQSVEAVDATQANDETAAPEPGNEGAESTSAAETLSSIAPAATNGEHDDEPTTTADAFAAGEPAEIASEDAVNNAAVESVGANGSLSAAAEEPEEPIEPTDVVIDYDEAFDASAVPATAGENRVEAMSDIAATTSGETPVPTSPKRSRKFEHEEGLEGANDQASNEAKRPRLAKPIPVSSA